MSTTIHMSPGIATGLCAAFLHTLRVGHDDSMNTNQSSHAQDIIQSIQPTQIAVVRLTNAVTKQKRTLGKIISICQYS